ncbi:MAG: hypothetical protein JSR55_10300 [Proteobacteria bacterium]|nr:hypothetical protein [Pseudomonadota bacterium]
MNIDGTNWLACTRHIADTAELATIYPLNHSRIVKDLVPDLNHLYAQYALIEPWLKTAHPTMAWAAAVIGWNDLPADIHPDLCERRFNQRIGSTT